MNLTAEQQFEVVVRVAQQLGHDGRRHGAGRSLREIGRQDFGLTNKEIEVIQTRVRRHAQKFGTSLTSDEMIAHQLEMQRAA